jgi:hypothetical protein
LRKLANCKHIVLDPVGGLEWVVDFDVEDSVDVEGDIVLGDSNLRVNLNNLFPQIMNVSNLVNEGNDEVDTWLQLFVELLEPVDQGRVVLAHNDEEAVVRNSSCQAFANVSCTPED